MHTYRVWFSNDTAVLVDAMNTNEARQKALIIAKQNGYAHIKVRKVETL